MTDSDTPQPTPQPEPAPAVEPVELPETTIQQEIANDQTWAQKGSTDDYEKR